MKKIGAIIQARCSSTRLPNKILLSLPYDSDISVLEQIIRRARKIKRINELIIATTASKTDNVTEAISNKLNIECFRGDEHNVLSRFFFAAKNSKLDIILRLTADNPCIDYNLIDSILEYHIEKENDYTATRYYPVGLGVEIISFNAMKKSFNEASKFFQKEHVTPYIYMNPSKFKICIKEAPKKYYYPDIRITLDTEEDYALLCAVFDHLHSKNEFFNIDDITNLFKEKPWLKLINKGVIQKKVLNTLEEEI